MLGRAAHRHASTTAGDKKQSTLLSNSSATNIPPANSRKRKLDRSMSTTSSLGSLHQQSWPDENTEPAFVDLTNSSEKHSDIHYPILKPLDAESYPSLPPVPKHSPAEPASSAPVAWSSSPAEHFEDPKTIISSRKPPSPAPLRPAKRRVLPASFTSRPAFAPRNELHGELGKDHKLERTAALKQHQGGVGREKASQVMSDMLEASSFTHQRMGASLSRSSSERPPGSLTKQTGIPAAETEKVPDVFLSDEQKAVMKAVMEEGKSVFFTGSAGTGKSVLMKAIIAQLRHKYRASPDRYAVTASTGLASCILEGQTLHSWSGIGLGKEPAPELVKKVKRNQKSRQRWLRTKVLIIDEVSMVDGQLFDKLEQVARTIRNNGRPFGGIQLVVTGDFFQLPPVPEKNATAKFVFEAVTWNTCIQHTILLTHVFRQKDEQFASMLNEMRLGKMSPATVREFKALSRPLKVVDELEATELYPRREEVENANTNRMRKLSGQVMTFTAVDSGNAEPNTRKALLSNFIAPEILELKKGAQVMLIKNIDGQLVNGSLGIVQSFMDEGTFFTYKDDEPTFLLAQEGGEDDDEEKKAAREKIREARLKNSANGETRKLWPMVRFNLPDGTSRSMLCAPDEWKTEAQNGEVLAKRVQVPLILAWALSIHKAQGQTLSRVKVDLGKVFEKGQAYVALSRARTKEGLQVLRFDERKVMVHQKVLEFYAKLAGHETLNKQQAKKEVKKDLFADEDDFEDDFSIEDMLEAEKMLKAGAGF
ncbi:ATP-dependent DNA helicase PIF1 [Cladophialophora carrionii]|uniref:ATP-dependent DNA helicase PIF1 n=1 Tax=Cladophialophora carrionii TaxID=86049 RepID=A0A1C1C9U7_9EURO|nr:ATP-dependent DNA helicase PIF1 [Cladophialophora carrionii]